MTVKVPVIENKEILTKWTLGSDRIWDFCEGSCSALILGSYPEVVLLALDQLGHCELQVLSTHGIGP